MEIDFIRDHAMYAAIFGFFGFSWFGWAQDNPPQSWRVLLGIASGVSFLIALTGGYLAYTHWGGASSLDTPEAYRQFGVIVGIEFTLAFVGAGILAWRKRQEWIAAWIAFVVGIHFIPLAAIFNDSWLHILAALLASVSIAAVIGAKKVHISATTLACAGAGCVVLLFALRGLLLVLLS